MGSTDNGDYVTWRKPMQVLTMRLEVEQGRKEPAIGEASVWVTELVKEWMDKSVQLHEQRSVVLDI